jgi:hypothetical protein
LLAVHWKNSFKEFVTGFLSVWKLHGPSDPEKFILAMYCNNQRWLMLFKIQQVLWILIQEIRFSYTKCQLIFLALVLLVTKLRVAIAP